MSDYILAKKALGASVGQVQPESVDFDSLSLDSGATLAPITIAYETYGRLNEERTNAVLILHALSGDAHAAGYYPGEDRPGWWETQIGPGKGFDTERYFVICSNVIAGCKGSTGPASINPDPGTELPAPGTNRRPTALPHRVGNVGTVQGLPERLNRCWR